MNVIMLRSVFAVSIIALSAFAGAQDVDESALDELDKRSAPVVVAREAPGSVELRAAMRRIAYSPGDADALADAGNAALMLGDANAALNFFTRASVIRPRNGRITSGLASATVRTENPFEALRLFDEAVKLGVSERSIAADRALAFDLLGNFARAQLDYNLARSASLSDQLVMRQAISLSLSGQKNEADAMLVPLLQKNNPEAWRARAFILAARGDYRESTKVTQGFMDARSAQKMERYLRQMPDLTRAQQAAAIHLGHFPANNVGRDSEDVRRIAATIPAVEPGKNDSRLIPAGAPLGQKAVAEKPIKETKKARREREREEKRVAKAVKTREPVKVAQADNKGLYTDRTRVQLEQARTTVQQAQVATAATARPGQLPPPDTARPLVKVALPTAREIAPNPTPPAAKPAPVSAVVTKAEVTPTPTPQPLPAPALPVAETQVRVATNMAAQGPTESGAPVTTAAVDTVRPAQVVTPSPTAPTPVRSAPPFDLAAIVGAIEIPESETKPSAVAVDLKRLRQAALKSVPTPEAVKGAKIDPKAVKPSGKGVAVASPARFWVQIATGEAGALTYDYRKWTKKTPELFKGQDGWTSPWGKTSRLLVGPFDDLKASKKWEADFRKAGGNGFGWKSENGVTVTPLKGK
jgi:Flp pilus assembly protein TadD